MHYRAQLTTLIRQTEKLHAEVDAEIDKIEKNHTNLEDTILSDLKKKRLQYNDELIRLKKLKNNT